MDYTNNLDASKQPDKSNYEALFGIYGPISGRRRRRQLRQEHDSNVLSATASTATATATATVDVVSTVPDHIRQKKKEAVQKLLQRIRRANDNDKNDNDNDNHTHEDGWKMLHRKKSHGEEHEMNLGEGYKVRIQLLLA